MSSTTNVEIELDGHRYTCRPVIRETGTITYSIDGLPVPTTVEIDRVIAADEVRLRDALESCLRRAALPVAA